jgi:hypothetical protein
MEGDTLVVMDDGLRDGGTGHRGSPRPTPKVTERFRRLNYGTPQSITIDDPKGIHRTVQRPGEPAHHSR